MAEEKKILWRIEFLGSDKISKEIRALTNDIEKFKLKNVELKQALKTAETATEYRNLTSVITDNNIALKQMTEQHKQLEKEFIVSKKTGQEMSNTLAGIRLRLNENKKAIEFIPRGTAEFKQMQKAISADENELRKFNAQMGRGSTFVGEYAKGFSNAFKNIGATMIAAFSVYAIKDFFGSAMEEYDKAVKAEAQLTTALKGRNDLAKELIQQAKQLQGLTLFSDDDITKGQAFGAALVKDADVLKQITPLVLDFAQAKGMELSQAFTVVGKAINGQETALKRAGIVIKETTDPAERLTLIMQAMDKAFGGQAQAAVTGTAALVQLKNAWRDVKEVIGGVVAGMLMPLVNGIKLAISPTQSLTEKYTELNNTFNSNKKQIQELLPEYTSLKNNTNRNEAEQKRLQEIINTIVKIMPEAATGFDRYGNAIDISTDKINKNTTAQQKYLTSLNKTAVNEARTAIDNYTKSIDEHLKVLKRGTIIETIGAMEGTITEQRKLSNKEILNYNKLNYDANVLIIEQYKKLEQLQGGLSKFDTYQKQRLERALGLNSVQEESNKITESEIKNIFYYTEKIKELNEEKSEQGTTLERIDKINKEIIINQTELNELENENTTSTKENSSEKEKAAQAELKRIEDVKKEQEDYYYWLRQMQDETTETEMDNLETSKTKELETLQEKFAKKLIDEEQYLTGRQVINDLYAMKFSEQKEKENEIEITALTDLFDNEIKLRETNNNEIDRIQKQKQALVHDFAASLGQGFGEMLTNTEKATKESIKKMLISMLGALRAYIYAKITAESLAQPDSVATFGLTGLARIGVLTGMTEAAFALASGIINSMEKGGIAQGSSHAEGGLLLYDKKTGGFTGQEIEGGEPILTKNVSRDPYLLQKASEINVLAGGKPLTPKPFMQAGGIVTNNVNTNMNIDYSRLAKEFSKVVTNIKVKNVVVDTTREQARVSNIQAEASSK